VLDIIAGRGVLCHDSCKNFEPVVLVTISEQAKSRVQPRDTLVSRPNAGSWSAGRLGPDSGGVFGFRNKPDRKLQKHPLVALQHSSEIRSFYSRYPQFRRLPRAFCVMTFVTPPA
jgi:hypothetical protein